MTTLLFYLESISPDNPLSLWERVRVRAD